MSTNNLCNFSIIAHIDHGKSTLADRLLELTGTIERRKMREQYLDMNPLEREKGITIKMQPVRMLWKPQHSETLNPKYEIRNKSQIGLEFSISNLGFANLEREFVLNLIDTPGHVDFSYEVSRALAAVEGAVLLVDATQGIQAQTVANLRLAEKCVRHNFQTGQDEEGLVIIPVINKIDLPSAEIKKCEAEIKDLLGTEPEEILKISGKTGAGVAELLEKIIIKIPSPRIPAKEDTPLQALIFDSAYDPYQGIIAYIRVFAGEVRGGENIYFLASGAKSEALEAGIFSPERKPKDKLQAGEIGYLATGLKEPEKVRVGDTITKLKYQNSNLKIENKIHPLPGYKEPEPMVYASIFPENQDDYENLRDALRKLKLNDAAIIFEPEQSTEALGRGFRAGFLGMLHTEIVSERLSREYNLKLIFSNPSVAFKVTTTKGEEKMIYSPAKLPENHLIQKIEEPWVMVELIAPVRFLGGLTILITEYGGLLTHTSSLAGDRLLLKFEAPLREIVVDFYDKLKSASEGFASMAYEISGYRANNLVRLDILVAGEKIPAFSEIIPKEKTYRRGRVVVEKLKELLPRALFAISLQAEAEGRIIARETISALKKDVTGYLYGGDRTRKMKLWKKQQRGKKRLLESARVDIPSEVFLKMMKSR